MYLWMGLNYWSTTSFFPLFCQHILDDLIVFYMGECTIQQSESPWLLLLLLHICQEQEELIPSLASRYVLIINAALWQSSILDIGN